MEFESLQKFFANSPAVRLIRSPHAYWIVDFLNQQFKTAGVIVRKHSELALALDNYLDQTVSPSNSRDKADTYLAAWCSSSTGWLKRFIEADVSEPCYQLTAEFEKALAFVQRAARDEDFVGTESRLRAILETLGSVVTGVADDPNQRLARLQEQRAEIDRQIQRLQDPSLSPQMSSTQVRERFSLAYQQFQQLKSEFRAVEDRFKSITREVQKRILGAEQSRGDILQFALDSEDNLKQGDQGQSFFEFLKLIHSPTSQDRISQLVRQLSEIEALAHEQEGLDELRSLVPTLIAEAEKILRTTQHLSVTLRRLLDSRSTRHHQQLAHVLRDILGAAARRSEQPPTEIGIEVEVDLEIQSPMDRPFWSATEPFDEVELATVQATEQDTANALGQLAALERLDWQAMRRNISVLTGKDKEVQLAKLLARFPATAGAIEILGYLQIAFDDGHQIDPGQLVELKNFATAPSDESPASPWRRKLTVPNVVFLPEGKRKRRTAVGVPRIPVST